MRVRVATYNVHGMRAGVPALARVVTALRPDVLCAQEVPRYLRWRGRRRALGVATGLTLVTPGRVGGVAVYAAPGARVLSAANHVLREYPRLERRALAVAVLEIGEARLAVGSFHLDLDAAARLDHAAEIMELMEEAAGRHDAAIVLGGDVNEQPHQPVWRHFADRLTDCCDGGGPTFPARGASMRIDTVFAARGTRVVPPGEPDAGIADLAGASDHLPAVAELRLGH